MTTGPGPHDESITAYIAGWGAELGDDDQERSRQRAHRQCWATIRSGFGAGLLERIDLDADHREEQGAPRG